MKALVTASLQRDQACNLNIRERTQGFVFLGTPHEGSRFTVFGRVVSLFGYWRGSNTELLELMEPESAVNRELHGDFLKACGSKDIVNFFETVRETLGNLSIIYVRSHRYC